jgi:uncharacterized protein YjbJ (UPF0337 family)
MNKDQVKGMIDEVSGCAKRKAGELTDNPKLQAEGIAQQVKGKAENAWGKTKGAVSDALKNAELHIDTSVHLEAKEATADAKRSKC